MLDCYIQGDVRRISPEAPVPVVSVQKCYQRLGGAANVAGNIKALGGEPLLFGLCGEDAAADQLRAILTDSAISSEYLLADKSLTTTTKTRVMSHHQQIVRFDSEAPEAVQQQVTDQLFERIAQHFSHVDAVILSDYRKGVLNDSLLEKLGELFRGSSTFVAVDPKRVDFSRYQHCSIITPNEAEASAAISAALGDFSPDQFVAKSQLLHQKLAIPHLLITRSEKGMLLLAEQPVELEAQSQQVFDPTGAGDTVIATLALAVAAGADMLSAATLSNIAASFTVRQVGAIGPRYQQLLQLLKN